MRILDRHFRLLGLALISCFLLITPAAAQTTPSDTSIVYLPLVTAAGPQSIEQQVVNLTNQQRQLNGCNVILTISPQLTTSAFAHSQDMAINNIFSHTGSDGSELQDRVVATGYDYQLLGENLAVGSSTAQDVVDRWMNSPGHRANILNCNFHEIGIGFYYQPDDQANVRNDDGTLDGPWHYYWTQDFGTSRAK